MSVSPFYFLFRAPSHSLSRFDPLPDEPLLRCIDPLASPRKVRPAGRPRVWRPAALWAAMTLPTLVFAWLQNPTPADFRAAHAKPGGLLTDVDLFSMWVIWACYLTVLLLGRRLIGSLIITLERTEVIAVREPGGWPIAPKRRWLQHLERFTRLRRSTAVVWFLGFLVVNAYFNVAGTLADGAQTWRSDPLAHGSIGSFFQRGSEQVNLAGFWHVGLASAVAGYLILLLCRLYVVFACMTDAIARDKSIRITPTHPDATGGLLAVGRASLFMALGVFVSGLGITAIVIQGWMTGQKMNAVFYGIAALYLLIGPMLFVLPLTQLRRVMMDAKQKYLLEAEQLYDSAHIAHRQHIRKMELRPDALEGQQALAEIIERAADMTVWPFDRRTFRRFVGLLVTPLLPMLKEIPLVQELISKIIGD